MKLEKLSRLLSAQDISAQNANTQAQEQAKVASADSAAAAVSNEAVKVAKDFGGESDSARSARVLELRKLVAEKNYQPDSREVAKSIIAELLA